MGLGVDRLVNAVRPAASASVIFVLCAGCSSDERTGGPAPVDEQAASASVALVHKAANAAWTSRPIAGDDYRRIERAMATGITDANMEGGSVATQVRRVGPFGAVLTICVETDTYALKRVVDYDNESISQRYTEEVDGCDRPLSPSRQSGDG